MLAPELQAALFPKDIIPAIGVVANLGLIFYMFLVGLEIDPSQLKGRIAQAAAISNASVALPMMLGIAVALPIYELVGPGHRSSSPSRCSWAWRCRSPPSPSWPGSWSSAGCSSAPWARSRSRARRSTT